MTRSVLPVGWVIAAVGCGGSDLPGHYWDVVIDGAANHCTGNAPDYHEEYEYRVVIEGNDVQVAIGPDVFANGRIEACNMVYTSLAWSDYRDDKEIQWEILGSARVNLGEGGGCVAQNDWEGIETFLVTFSAHPDVSAGCTYETTVTGTYVREVE